MITGAQNTLFLPFENETLDLPQAGEKFLCFGISADTMLSTEWKQALHCIQPSRPEWLALNKAGFQVTAQITENETYAGGMILLGKHRGRNEEWLASLLSQVKPGGLIVIAGDKKLGIDSFRKRSDQIATSLDRMSKNHAVTYWMMRPEAIEAETIQDLIPERKRVDERFWTKPGMFSHGEIDRGSALLVPHLKNVAFGHVADLGAGWGYLTACCLDNPAKISRIDLYEADFEALEIAKSNLAELNSSVPLHYYWHDVASEPMTEIYDTVISNPPFHTGRNTDISLGQSFITSAAKRLKSGGRLLMVANRQLPYEAVLKQHFRQVMPLTDKDGFKVIEARK
ncbi:class I SAM-dependent methyltransferase [Pseudochrobactrum sp. sp1633]|uniref:class I SAM-dependent methyltransferase n=1 Tax=Pseudochrobactrum sp. sp1633 TaxID=3036706 RepID=UPI0025A5DC99|nr:class I SAM-dependent methyltransferase [Pseudochrobactrum sp. sp1633]MDM8344899.1 class I SAM-dependent methyltransferase [Pseudochrobactrum sp. sp1633]HWD14731.1 class I SAM-dependent methyltransferase [Pseudochrobactrum sp.]